MTRDEADSAQDWASLGGGEAFALIERHADDNQEAHEMMEAWKRAHVKAEREACAILVGATGAYGTAITRRLLDAGLGVIAVARSADSLQALTAQYPGVRACAADISNDSAIAAIAARDEIFEARWCFGKEFKDELAHGGLVAARYGQRARR